MTRNVRTSQGGTRRRDAPDAGGGEIQFEGRGKSIFRFKGHSIRGLLWWRDKGATLILLGDFLGYTKMKKWRHYDARKAKKQDRYGYISLACAVCLVVVVVVVIIDLVIHLFYTVYILSIIHSKTHTHTHTHTRSKYSNTSKSNKE
jgi:hypothetical protein